MGPADRCEFHLADGVDLGMGKLMEGKDFHVSLALDREPSDTPKLQVGVVRKEVGYRAIDHAGPRSDGRDR
jgi:hypothetical protein